MIQPYVKSSGQKGVMLDIIRASPDPHGEQQPSVWNEHHECTCDHSLFVFNQFGDLDSCAVRPRNVHTADEWEGVL